MGNCKFFEFIYVVLFIIYSLNVFSNEIDSAEVQSVNQEFSHYVRALGLKDESSRPAWNEVNKEAFLGHTFAHKSSFISFRKDGEREIRIGKDELGNTMAFEISDLNPPVKMFQDQKKTDNTQRHFRFFFPNYSLNRFQIQIADQTGMNRGRASHEEMLHEVMFFPRTHVPAFHYFENFEGREEVHVQVMTGEIFKIDATSMEFTPDSIFHIEPMDISPNRFTRNFSKLSYNGYGVIVISQFRGDSPRDQNPYSGGAVRSKDVQVRYQDEGTDRSYECSLYPKDLFDQTDGRLLFRFSTDEKFYEFLKQNCEGWESLTLPLSL